MCNVKTKVFPLMIGENEITSKSFRKYLSNISGEHEVKKLQKNSHIGLCTHTLESANVKVRNFYVGK